MVLLAERAGHPLHLDRLHPGNFLQAEHRMVDLVADRVGSGFKQLAKLVGRSGSIVRR